MQHVVEVHKDTPIEELDTPSLVADIDQVERNLMDMQDYANRMGKKLRPHSKTHKNPTLAKKQMQFGAVGVCTQKVSEAEVLVQNGVTNVLVSNEVIGLPKLRRFAELSRKATMALCVDSVEGVEQLAQVSNETGLELSCLVDVDVGMHRCGVTPSEAAKLAKLVSSKKGLRIKGMMGYERHIAHHPVSEWEARVKEAMNVVSEAKQAIEAEGIRVEDVVVGGTPSSKISGKYDVMTELTPGEYIYYGYDHVETGICKMQDIALSIYCTVMSKPTQDRAVIDGGLKTFDFDQGDFSRLRDESLKAKLVSFSEEHGVLHLEDDDARTRVKIGSRLEFVPYHICTCINLHNYVNLARKGRIVEVLPTLGRGMVK